MHDCTILLLWRLWIFEISYLAMVLYCSAFDCVSKCFIIIQPLFPHMEVEKPNHLVILMYGDTVVLTYQRYSLKTTLYSIDPASWGPESIILSMAFFSAGEQICNYIQQKENTKGYVLMWVYLDECQKSPPANNSSTVEHFLGGMNTFAFDNFVNFFPVLPFFLVEGGPTWQVLIFSQRRSRNAA